MSRVFDGDLRAVNLTLNCEADCTVDCPKQNEELSPLMQSAPARLC